MRHSTPTAWEYHEEAMFDGPADERRARLAELGSKGWELVSVVASPKSFSPMCIFYFKRPAP